MTTLHEFTLEATRRYLQSVVFVDDLIYQPITLKPMVEINVPKINSVFKTPAPSTGSSTSKVSSDLSPPITDISAAPFSVDKNLEEAPQYHPKQLVESFARERIVCALYEPAKGFSSGPDSELFKLCERADVIILDWDLYNEDGINILPLIAGLINQSQTTVPHHVRLCAIYTTKPDLSRVANQIFDYLRKESLDVEADELTLTAGASRIVVLGKPTIGRSGQQKSKAEVTESELAARIILEFASMHQGILPSIALHGMGTVRTSSKKILDKFSSKMDGAFLVHRGLLLPADDAYDQLPELLAEEALALMIDSRLSTDVATMLSNEVIDKWNINLELQVKSSRDVPARGEIAIKILKHGLASVERDIDFDKQKSLVVKLHEAMGAASTKADMQLAALFSTRTSYSDHKDLTFGTILREVSSEPPAFLLCLMPLCDSVRLKHGTGKSYAFPFWRLKLNNSGAQSRGMAVSLPEGGYCELFVMGKPRDQLVIIEFTANAAGIVSAIDNNGKYIVSAASADLGEFEWISQLKPTHAQRIAQDVGNSFARVGLVEAEWLRLKTERNG